MDCCLSWRCDVETAKTPGACCVALTVNDAFSTIAFRLFDPELYESAVIVIKTRKGRVFIGCGKVLIGYDGTFIPK